MVAVGEQTGLIRYEAARKALAEATRIDEVKAIGNKAHALAAYARQAKDHELETMAAEIRVRAQRRLGELSKALDKDGGGRPRKTLATGGKSLKPTKAEALKAAGISSSVANRCELLAEVPEGEFEAYVGKKRAKGQAVSAKEVTQMVGKKVRRTRKLAAIKERTLSAPYCKLYNLIYADPPWRYDAGEMTESRRIENHYPTLPLADIEALRFADGRTVSDIAAPDCVLFLWATSPGLQDAFGVIERWGFQYRASLVWVKPSIGAGQWVRNRHELLLIGVRGKIPVPAESDRPDSVIEAPRGHHSAKPEAAIAAIERAYGDFVKTGTAIELFQRTARPGWAGWGLEAKESAA